MEIRKERRYFTIFEHEKEQEYLREKHKAGWKLVTVTGFCKYHFQKCEPEDVIYQLDYNKDGIAHKNEYVQMFEDCGWEYLMDYVGYSYFRKPLSEMNDEEEIFCDDRSRLEMMERVFRGRIIPLIVLFSLILVPRFIISAFQEPDYVLATLYGIIIILYMTIFISYAIKHNQYKKNI